MMRMRILQRRQRSRWTTFKRLLAGAIFMMTLAVVGWMSSWVWQPRQAAQVQMPGQDFVMFFDYTVTADPGRVRINGTANLPNGVMLMATLDKIGVATVEIKEALVMNRLFAVEFGPELRLQYPWLGQVEGLTPGAYRLNVEFDPSQQSPLTRQFLPRDDLMKSSTVKGDDPRQAEATVIRVTKVFGIGTSDEQQQAQAREKQYRQLIGQRLNETLITLYTLWQRLHSHYQQERVQGPFARTDPRAHTWQTQSGQWLGELKAAAEKYQLDEVVSPASPHYSLRDSLVVVYKQLQVLRDLYFEVLISQRPFNDRDLQRVEQQLQHALGDAIAQLGQPDMPSLPIKAENVKPTVIVTSPLVNIRSGPGMGYGVVSQIKKDEVLAFLGEQGEWFQVQLSGGRTGWIHRNVASRESLADGAAAKAKRSDSKLSFSEGRVILQLEPIGLLATPIAYIPQPTQDELRIYAELEPQLRDLSSRNLQERQIVEQQILQRLSDKYGISPKQAWNAYLKVQGWEIVQ
jgi:SH3-like domain-containing protein